MKLKADLGNKKIELDIVYRNRRSLAIKIEPPDTITVLSPKGLDIAQIIKKVISKSGWINKKLDEFKAIGQEVFERKYIQGELYLYLGRKYPLFVKEGKTRKRPKVEMLTDRLVVYSPSRNNLDIKKELIKWYRKSAQSVFTRRAIPYLAVSAKRPLEIKAKEQKRRWGSCTPDGKIYINWRIAMAPLPVIDYILVHEISHLYHRDHSWHFWDKVSYFMPDYIERKRWLRKNGLMLDI